MPSYVVIFRCKPINAIGVYQRVPFEVTAANPQFAIEIARKEAYKTHEHLDTPPEVQFSKAEFLKRHKGGL